MTNGSAYNGLLSVSTGLGILKSVFIIPDAFNNDEMYENSASAATYFSCQNNIKHTILTLGDSYLQYKVGESGKATLTSFGNQAIVFTNKGTSFNTSTTTSGKLPVMTPRQATGFEQLFLSFADSTLSLEVGSGLRFQEVKTVTSTMTQVSNSESFLGFEVYPNPCVNGFYLDIKLTNPSKALIFNSQGKEVSTFLTQKGTQFIKTENYIPGLYFIKLNNSSNHVQKILISK